MAEANKIKYVFWMYATQMFPNKFHERFSIPCSNTFIENTGEQIASVKYFYVY